jgi:GNAT superfamily N-acetyltransferase
MIDPDVRDASGDDASQLAMLEAESRAFLAGQRGGVRWLATHPERGAAWPGAIADNEVLVAHIGEVVVGYLVLTVADAIAFVDDVYVTPEARELGFGDAMLAAATERARSAGCSLIEGFALPGDRDTKNLYERAAIKARLITVSAEL